jgi:hypothetical protein
MDSVGNIGMYPDGFYANDSGRIQAEDQPVRRASVQLQQDQRRSEIMKRIAHHRRDLGCAVSPRRGGR